MSKNTITWKDIDPAVYGKGLHDKFRRNFNNKLYSRYFVIQRIDITWNAQCQKFDEEKYLTLAVQNPMFEEFGYDVNYKEANVKVNKIDDKDNKTALRINIDGDKYIWCDSIIAIKAGTESKILELADKGYTLDVTKYMAATASPGNEKHSVKYYAKMVEGMTEEDIFDHIDNLMGGALSDTLCNGLVSGKDIGKSNTRIGNYASGMIKVFDIDLAIERIAIVKGSIFQASDFDEATEEMMKQVGVEIDNNINDGAAFVTPEKMMEAGLSVGTKLTYEAALKSHIQSRAKVVNWKVLLQTRPGEVIADMADFYGAKVFGNPNGPIVAIVDTDGAKMVNWSALKDNTTKIEVFGMAIAHASGVKSCNQHLIKYMAVDPERTLEIVKRLSTLAVDDFVANKLEEEDGQGYTVNGKIMAKLPAHEVYNDSILMETLISEAETYVKTMIAENKIAIEGQYTHMEFDTSYAMTRGLVKAILDKTVDGIVEAYSPDVLETYAPEIEAIENDSTLTEEQKDQELFNILSGVVIKFPSAMPDEYELIVYKTDRQIRRRIKEVVEALDINNKEKVKMIDLLNNYFKHAAWGTTIYAPINAMKNKLAGADIDFDATMVDMSELKWILIDKRRAEQEENPGCMGNCTFIKYGQVVRKPVEQEVEETIVTEFDDVDM